MKELNDGMITEESRYIFREMRNTICRLGLLTQWKPLMIQTHQFCKKYRVANANSENSKIQTTTNTSKT
jgi:hypothetical protein